MREIGAESEREGATSWGRGMRGKSVNCWSLIKNRGEHGSESPVNPARHEPDQFNFLEILEVSESEPNERSGLVRFMSFTF